MRLSSHVSNVSAHQRSGVYTANVGGTSIKPAEVVGNNITVGASIKSPKGTPEENARFLTETLVQNAIVHFKRLSPEQMQTEGAVAFCAPGLVKQNSQGHYIFETSGNLNLPKDFNFTQAFQEELKKRGITDAHNIPVVVTNDAVGPANGIEGAKAGAYLINGTGTGGVTFRDVDGVRVVLPGETGHLRVAGAGSETLEDTVSGRAIARRVQEMAKKQGLTEFAGIKVADLYSPADDSNLYDTTTRRFFANGSLTKQAPHMVDQGHVVSNLSAKEKKIIADLEKDLHMQLGKWISSYMLVNAGTEKVVLAGSVFAFMDKQLLAEATNAQIGDKMASLRIKNSDTFFEKEDSKLAFRGLANMAKHALAKTQKAVQNQVQDLPKESGMGAWHVVGGVLAGAVLGFVAHMLTAPKKTPDANTASTTPTENKPDSSTQDRFTKS